MKKLSILDERGVQTTEGQWMSKQKKGQDENEQKREKLELKTKLDASYIDNSVDIIA